MNLHLFKLGGSPDYRHWRYQRYVLDNDPPNGSQIARIFRHLAVSPLRRLGCGYAALWPLLLLIWLLLAWPGHAAITLNYPFTVNQDIPDNGELLNTQTLSGVDNAILKVRVRLNLSGRTTDSGFNGDLYVLLRHNDTIAVLLNRPGNSASLSLGYPDSGFDITFDDAALQGDIHVYRQTLFGNETTPLSGPLTDLWAPDGRETDPDSVVTSDPRTATLSAFQSQGFVGEWSLFIADLSPGGVHRLNSWELEITAIPEPLHSTLVGAGFCLLAIGGHHLPRGRNKLN